MPFTFSHPAAVLPLSAIPKRYISVSALIIGSITPDFELFIRFHQHRTVSHTWPGIFSFDLPFGLFLLLLFNLIIRNALIDHLPLVLNRRFSRFKRVPGKQNIQRNYLPVFFSLLVGIVTHLVWDKLTHRTGDIIEETWGSFHGLIWDAGSIVGAFLILLSVYKLPKKAATKRTHILPFWIGILFVAIGYAWFYLPYAKTRNNIGISFITGSLIGLTVLCCIDAIRLKWMRTASDVQVQGH